MQATEKIKELILKSADFVLVGHEKPDGDSIGSLLAMGQALESIGKNVRYVLHDDLSPVFTFLEGVGKFEHELGMVDDSVIILLDNGDLRRTGFAELISKIGKKISLINIDHHPRNDIWKLATWNLVDESASSTSEIVYSLIKVLGVEITPQIATALLTGLYTDTGGFQHANTSPRVLEIVSNLLKRGARLKKISENISGSRSITMLKLWGTALNHLVFNEKFGLFYSILRREDIEAVHANEDDISGLVNLLNSAPESRLSMLLYETSDGKIRGSLRTENDSVDLSLLAMHLGGGGHKRASGFTINGRIVEEDGKWMVV